MHVDHARVNVFGPHGNQRASDDGSKIATFLLKTCCCWNLGRPAAVVLQRRHHEWRALGVCRDAGLVDSSLELDVDANGHLGSARDW